MQTITLEQLAQHDGKDGRPNWIQIGHEVFNMTSFQDFHPGGKSALQKAAGKDATQAFNLFHGAQVMPKYHDKFKVGEIASAKQELEALAQKREFVRSALLDVDLAFGDQIPYGDPAFYQRQAAHSPYYRETHRKFRKEVREFVDQEIIATMHAWKNDNAPPMDLVGKLGQRGYLACMAGGTPFPHEHVDPGTPCPEDFDFFHIQILFDEIARCGDSSVLSALTNGPSIAVCALLKFGSAELKQSGVIREVLMGRKMIALAVTEPVGGSDVAALACELDVDAMTVTGNKKFITNGMYADYLTLLAKEKHTGKMTMVLVDCQSAHGYKAVKCKVRGSELSGTALLDFCDTKVMHLVGERGQGFKLQMAAFNFERWYVSVCAVRLARNLLEESIKYCLKRHTFGKALHEHQAIRMRIAEMIRDIESVQAWIDAITFQMNSLDISKAALVLGDVVASAKVQVSLVYERCARHCTHIFGGNSLQIDSAGGRVESSLIQMKGYLIPAGAADILDDFTVRTVFRLASNIAKL